MQRQAAVFTPLWLEPPKPEQRDRPRLNQERDCYVCKQPFTTVHRFYDSMCEACGDFNYAKRTQTADLRGTLVAVPVVNAFGLLRQTRELPDGRDLNRTFPGSPRGSLAARVAHALLQEVVKRCTHGVDLHTAAQDRSNYPQIRADLRDRGSREMAAAFGAPVTVQAGLRDGSLREAATALGIPTVLFETGEALRHDEQSLRVGVRGVRGVMAHLGMIDPLPGPAPKSRVCTKSKWVRAEASGYLVGLAPLGAEVKRGERLGTISVRKDRTGEPSGEYVVRSAEDGIVIGRRENPLVYEGDAIFHVALGGKARKKKRARA